MVGIKVCLSFAGSEVALSFPQILWKSLWKSWGIFLQSCYKRALTTFCTRERRDEKPLRLNVLVLSQSITRRLSLMVQLRNQNTTRSSKDSPRDYILWDHRRDIRTSSAKQSANAFSTNDRTRILLTKSTAAPSRSRYLNRNFVRCRTYSCNANNSYIAG